MQISHKLTRIILSLAFLVALAALSFAQVPIDGQAGAANNIIEVSDQKPGSILVYPYYTSSTGQTKTDTRITLTNLMGTIAAIPAGGGNGSVNVHLFFIEGSSCNQADLFVCLTKGASVSFKASDYDPDRTGYVIAVAVDAMGNPIYWNSLVGNAFVNAGTVVGNYGAEAFAAVGPLAQIRRIIAAPNAVPGLADLRLDGVMYDRAADQFAVEIQSPNDATGQMIVQTAVTGNVSTGAMNSVAQNGTGLVWRGDEKLVSFVKFIGGGCQSLNTITASNPRIPTGLGVFLPKGSNGTVIYNTTNPSVGLLITPTGNAWSGIRTLHKTRTAPGTLTIPVFMPSC